jgi:predicted dinucleotide-utilizing enzyme
MANRPHLNVGQVNHMGMGAAGTTMSEADRNQRERTEFQAFCKREQEYHAAMANMYEFMCANDLLAGDQATGEMMRTIFMAGIQALAKESK